MIKGVFTKTAVILCSVDSYNFFCPCQLLVISGKVNTNIRKIIISKKQNKNKTQGCA